MYWLMLDLETMSTKPDSAIIAIGAVVADENFNVVAEFEVCVDPQDAMRYGRCDGETVLWWLQQQAWRKAWSGEASLLSALHRLLDFLVPFQNQITEVWANPPSFDLVILKNALNQFNLEWPFSHRDERDFRTYWKMTCKRLKVDLNRIEPNEPHMPLSDCLAQIQSLKVLRSIEREYDRCPSKLRPE